MDILLRRFPVANLCGVFGTSILRSVAADRSSIVKRPPTSFALYLADKFPSLKQKFPDLKQSEILRQVSELWKNETDAAKKTYSDEFDRRNKEYAEFKRTAAPPRRPPGAFVQFSKEHHVELKARNPSASATELAKHAASMWQQVPLAERQQYLDKYKRDIVVYNKNLSDEDRQKLSQRLEKRALRRYGKDALAELPKRPATNGFSVFLREQASAAREERDFSGNVITHLSNKWKAMSAADKLQYNEKARKANQAFKEELDAWKKAHARY